MLQFFCLDLGCQHARGEAYLSTGILDAEDVVLGERCNDACSISTKRWKEQFLPVYRLAVVVFLKYLMQMGKILQDLDRKTPVLLFLAGSMFWKETLFNWVAGGESRVQVDALFISFTVAGIIQLQMNGPSLQWTIRRIYNNANNGFLEANVGSPFYKMDAALQGMSLFSDDRVRRRNPASMTIDEHYT